MEYCRFGNLLVFMHRHRKCFINQVDPVTGQIDHSKLTIDPTSPLSPVSHSLRWDVDLNYMILQIHTCVMWYQWNFSYFNWNSSGMTVKWAWNFFFFFTFHSISSIFNNLFSYASPTPSSSYASVKLYLTEATNLYILLSMTSMIVKWYY